jgi:hypothetical protein
MGTPILSRSILARLTSAWQAYPVSILVYRAVLCIGDLALNECTIRSARAPEGARWWQLWALVRQAIGETFYVGVPVNPNGPYLETGPSGRRTWGLTRASATDWHISPSIDVGPGLWHETPVIVGVPEGERWITEPP